MTIREAGQEDFDFLASMLLEAMNWNGEARVTPVSIRLSRENWHYIDGWKRESDFGVVSVGENGAPVGAAWARSFDAADPGYGFVDENIPEITMGVRSNHRGKGAGRMLLAALIVMGRSRGLPGFSLSVEDDNDRARSLYESHGFEVVGRVGDSDAMLIRF